MLDWDQKCGENSWQFYRKPLIFADTQPNFKYNDQNQEM